MMKQLETALSRKKVQKARGDVFAGIASGIPQSPKIGFFGTTWGLRNPAGETIENNTVRKKGRKARGDVFTGIASGFPQSPQIGFFGMIQPAECYTERPLQTCPLTG
jgi:hypothetical protein